MIHETPLNLQTASETGPLLEARGLTITAGGNVLHTGLSLALMPGELVAVTGPSGSGKTTLLRTIVGLQDAAAGSVLLQGRDAEQWGWPEFRRRVVPVTQKPILMEMSVEGNLRQPFTYRTTQSPFPEERARDLLNACSVGAERMGQDARTLSVGQQQRVSLIRALLLSPPVLCMDEPTSALDPEAAEQVQEIISAEAAGRGLAALIVTHSVKQAQEWCVRRFSTPTEPQELGWPHILNGKPALISAPTRTAYRQFSGPACRYSLSNGPSTSSITT